MLADVFKVGAYCTACQYSDAHAYEIIARTRTTLTLRRLKATLLNGAASGEPDALTFEPGGFVGHTSGRQRYRYESGDPGATVPVVARWSAKKAYFRLDGARIIEGAHEHYDFNY